MYEAWRGGLGHPPGKAGGGNLLTSLFKLLLTQGGQDDDDDYDNDIQKTGGSGVAFHARPPHLPCPVGRNLILLLQGGTGILRWGWCHVRRLG